MGVQAWRWAAPAFLGVAFLRCPQRTEAGWHERANRGLEDVMIGSGPTTTVKYPTYTHGPSGGLDATITFAEPAWYQQDTLTEGNGETAFAEQHSFQPVYVPPQPGHPGSSLLSLAKVLQKSNPSVQAALLRHFCHSVARLATRFVGFNSSMARNDNSSKEKDSISGGKAYTEAVERRIATLTAKLTGVLGAADGSSQSPKMLTKFMLTPFGKLLQEIESLLVEIAMHGDANLMISALSQLGPHIVQGLAYLEAPQSQGVAGPLEPARENCLKRARELDSALFAGQADLEGVLRAYPRDFQEDELERVKQIATLEGLDKVPYIPPVWETGSHGNLGANDGDKRSRAASAILVCLLFFTLYYTTTAAMSPPVKERKSINRRGGWHHRRTGTRDDDDGGYVETGFHHGAGQGMQWPSSEAERAHQAAFAGMQQQMGSQDMYYPDGFTATGAGGQGNYWASQGFPSSSSFQSQYGWQQPYPAPPDYAPPAYSPPSHMQQQNFGEAGRVTPSAPPFPGDVTPPGFPPPPPYSEAVKLAPYRPK